MGIDASLILRIKKPTIVFVTGSDLNICICSHTNAAHIAVIESYLSYLFEWYLNKILSTAQQSKKKKEKKFKQFYRTRVVF